jgi:hypothetical protein
MEDSRMEKNRRSRKQSTVRFLLRPTDPPEREKEMKKEMSMCHSTQQSRACQAHFRKELMFLSLTHCIPGPVIRISQQKKLRLREGKCFVRDYTARKWQNRDHTHVMYSFSSSSFPHHLAPCSQCLEFNIDKGE